MKVTNVNIFIFILTIYFVKQLNFDINMIVNLTILAAAVYYYVNENKIDDNRKKLLTNFLNTDKTTTNENLFSEIDIIKTEPILEHLEELKLFSEKYETINTDVIQEIILHTNTFFKDRSIFYREHINKLLDEIDDIHSENETQRSEYIEIKTNIVNELNKIVEINEPVSFHQFDGHYNLY